jgi:hypothetical protein
MQKTADKGGLDALREILHTDAKLTRFGNSESCIESSCSSGSVRAKDVYRALVQCLSHYDGHRFIVDKDPRLIEHLSVLQGLFRELVVVAVSRDPRDVLVSKMKADWSKHRPIWRHLIAGRAQFRLWLDFLPKSAEGNVFEVKYESLLADPEGVLKDLFGKMGLDYQESALNFGRTSQDLVSREELSWKKETLGPLLSSNSGKWLDELTAYQVRLCESVCSDAMTYGNYSPAPVRLQGGDYIRCSIVSFFLRRVADLYVFIRTIWNAGIVLSLRQKAVAR